MGLVCNEAQSVKNAKHYNKVLRLLMVINAKKIVIDTCIYQIMPPFFLHRTLDFLEQLRKFQEEILLFPKVFKCK